MEELENMDLSVIEQSPRAKNKSSRTKKNSNQQATFSSANSPYVPTYFTKIRKIDYESIIDSQRAHPSPHLTSKHNPKTKGKSEMETPHSGKKIENKVLPSSDSSMMIKNMQERFSIGTSMMNMDTDERAGVNPTDPHDRLMLNQTFFSVMEDQSNIFNDTSGVSLISNLGLDFFQDDDLNQFHYQKVIEQAQPFDVVDLDCDLLRFDSLEIKFPLHIRGNGMTTLFIKEGISIDYRKWIVNGAEGYKGWAAKKLDLEDFIYDLEDDRVIFEKVKIKWIRENKKSIKVDMDKGDKIVNLDNKTKSISTGVSPMNSLIMNNSFKRQTSTTSPRKGIREQEGMTLSLFDLKSETQIEFIDCLIKKHEEIGEDLINELKQLTKEGAEAIVDKAADPYHYYMFSTSTLPKFTLPIFFQTSFAEGFSSVKSERIKSLVIDQAYFTNFSHNVLNIFEEDDILFKDSKIMYQDSVGIFIDLQTAAKESHSVVISNSNFDKNEDRSIFILGGSESKHNSFNKVIIKDCSFQLNRSVCVEALFLHLKNFVFRDCGFLKNERCCISLKLCRNVKLEENTYTSIESEALLLSGSEVTVSKNQFDDVFHGVWVQNLGLGSPKKVYMDVLIEKCQFHKCLSTAFNLSGVALGSVKIHLCSVNKASVGIFIEEVPSYDAFQKKYKNEKLEISKLKMKNILQAGLAVKTLISTMSLHITEMEVRRSMEILIEKEEEEVKKRIELVEGNKAERYVKIEQIKLFEMNVKEQQKKEMRQRRRIIPKDDRNSCTLV